MKQKKQHILITGGAGFIGSNLANHLSAQGQTVTALDNLFLGDPENLSNQVRFVEGDACQKETLEALGHFDTIIHLAGTSSQPMFATNLVAAYRNSTESFLQVLEFAKATNVRRVLYASTSSIYGNNPIPLTEDQHVTPPNHYAVTKHFMEEVADCYNRVHPEMDIVGFRFMSVYGPHEEHKGQFANLISQFVWGMMRGEQPVIYGDGTQTRDFTNVMDVVQGMSLAMDHPAPLGSEIFNIGTSKALNLIDLVNTINHVLGTNVQPKFIENPVKEQYVRNQQADIAKITSILGYQPRVDLQEGIAQIVENLRGRKTKSVRDRSAEANRIPQLP